MKVVQNYPRTNTISREVDDPGSVSGDRHCFDVEHHKFGLVKQAKLGVVGYDFDPIINDSKSRIICK